MNNNKKINILSNCYLKDNKVIVQNDFKNTIKYIKDKYHYDMLKQITAVDSQENGTELIYHLYNVEDDENLLLSFTTSKEIETVTDIYESAIADENEIYDLFGIIFINNMNLKRLYMPENWEGFPLKKDYIQNDTRLAWNDNDKTEA